MTMYPTINFPIISELDQLQVAYMRSLASVQRSLILADSASTTAVTDVAPVPTTIKKKHPDGIHSFISVCYSPALVEYLTPFLQRWHDSTRESSTEWRSWHSTTWRRAKRWQAGWCSARQAGVTGWPSHTPH